MKKPIIKIGDNIQFYIDIELYDGEIIKIHDKYVDAITHIGIINNIPLSEIIK